MVQSYFLSSTKSEEIIVYLSKEEFRKTGKDLALSASVLSIISAGSIYSYLYMFLCFFLFNKQRNHFLYSLIRVSAQPEIEKATVVLIIFVCVKVMFMHCIVNT